jgi:uncharacterized RDD family membrane protein YckC
MSAPRLPGTGTGRRRAGDRPSDGRAARPSTFEAAAVSVPPETAPSPTAELPASRDEPPAGLATPTSAAPTPPSHLSAPPAPLTGRALAAAVDLGVPLVIYLVAGLASTALRDVGNRPAVTVLLLGYMGILAWVGWQVVAQGRTGQSVGKRLAHVRVVDAEGSPTGPARSALRTAAHLLDLLPAGLGFLWPIWDERRQTFADKLLGTTVLRS